MTNILFSRANPTNIKLANNIEVILNEQRHQRMDLASLLRKMDVILKQLDLEKKLSSSLDEYYETQAEHEPPLEDMAKLEDPRQNLD